MASPAMYATPAHLRQTTKLWPASGAYGTLRIKHQADRTRAHRHPLPHYLLWRSLTPHGVYTYNQGSVSRHGEGEGMRSYHQYFAHAKDPADRCRTGREFELLRILRGRMWKKAMPTPQYVDPKAKPTWLFKSWDDPFDSLQMWQRELWYDNHVPTHIGAKRPLAVLAPSTYHKQMSLVHIDTIAVTVCPFLFGFGHTLQKAVLDFYRRCLSGRSLVPNEKVKLYYTSAYVAPRVEVTWRDGQKWSPPLHDGIKTQEIIQAVMEQAWLETDRMDASGVTLPALTVDDFKWQEVILYKKKKKAADAKGAAKKK